MKECFCCSAVLLLIFMDICSAAAIKSETSKPLVIFQHRKSKNDSMPEIQQGACPKCPKHERPMDCAELRENGITESGVYTIYPRSRLGDCKSIDVYCDMTTDGGGWIVIQRRGQYGNGEDYFVKKWKEFKEGFGNLKKEFWLGNDKIYSITNQGRYAVRFEMKHVNGNSAFALYENFWIETEDANYKLHISDYSGTAGNAIGNHDGWPFYAVDKENRAPEHRNPRSGGWWLNNSPSSSLNGLNFYKSDKIHTYNGINWMTYGGFANSFESTEIKLRPKKFH
ncbi:techylectin-5A-like [Argiope bruennichi]|uniref:techylectin-5A-like n=1 Tax=Argiope bruennichi TaxID=94029 RepID=UPI0024947805|nr:techylectin-5A-like [Argiope bruennichi]XP_055953869.1 techylectin-5A-like [Argiope bruennichi]